MKKLTAALLVCAVSLVFACSKGNYQDDARAMINDFIPQIEKTTAALDKAATPKEAASALNDYADYMKKFVERSKELKKKYGDKTPESDPSLKAEEEKMKKLMESFGMAMSKVMMKWGTSTELMDSLKKLTSITVE